MRSGSPLLVVISGPSGVGKDAVLARMKELGLPFHYTVTMTTRPMRPGERDGVDYIFVDEATFRRLKAEGGLLEWAQVYGYLYGVPREQVRQALDRGQDVVVKVDVQGAENIRRLAPQALFIFLAPPSMEELARRLSERMTESPQALKLRLEAARREMEAARRFDYVVVNQTDRLDDTVREIEAIVGREKARHPPRTVRV